MNSAADVNSQIHRWAQRSVSRGSCRSASIIATMTRSHFMGFKAALPCHMNHLLQTKVSGLALPAASLSTCCNVRMAASFSKPTSYAQRKLTNPAEGGYCSVLAQAAMELHLTFQHLLISTWHVHADGDAAQSKLQLLQL